MFHSELCKRKFDYPAILRYISNFTCSKVFLNRDFARIFRLSDRFSDFVRLENEGKRLIKKLGWKIWEIEKWDNEDALYNSFREYSRINSLKVRKRKEAINMNEDINKAIGHEKWKMMQIRGDSGYFIGKRKRKKGDNW